MSVRPDSSMTLADWQVFIEKRLVERGFNGKPVQDEFILLVEEVGELAKALRATSGGKMATDSAKSDIEHEIADVFWMLASVANSLGVSISEAVISKDTKNNTRIWQ